MMCGWEDPSLSGKDFLKYRVSFVLYLRTQISKIIWNASPDQKWTVALKIGGNKFKEEINILPA